jgi:DNA (cytosine-5)-methyltransferase 1
VNYLSVFSGIEAATSAWHTLGWRPLAFAEIEPFPAAVLAHHYPDVPNLGDVTKFHEWPNEFDGGRTPDCLVGGSPCQAFSIAGLREGLADPRGNLTLTFLGVAAKYLPRWLVWENVPGVLSSITTEHPPEMAAPDDLQEGEERECVEDYEADSSHALSCFLDGLQKLGYGCALRCHDAQYAGLAQRRRRVFVVGYLGDWRRAAEVLFEPDCLRWNPPPSREAGKKNTGSLSARTEGGGGLGTDFDIAGGLQASVGGADENDATDGRLVADTGSRVLSADLAPTLNAHFGKKQGLENQHVNGGGLFVVRHSGHIDQQGQQERTDGRRHESPDSCASRRFL